MTENDPRPSFLAKEGEAEIYAKENLVGKEPCLMCSNPNTVALGAFSPDPEEKEQYAVKGQNPKELGTMFFPLCVDCANEAPGEQTEFTWGVQERLKYNAKRSKEV